MLRKVKWLLSRPRALWRASTVLGFRTTLQLAWIRMRGTREATYQVRVPGYPHPITIRGGQSTDAWALYQILVRGEYAAVGNLDSVKFIIDAGANIGIASLYFLHQYADARIVAIEPSAANFELLRQNTAPYASRIRLVQGALWTTAGTLDLDFRGEDWLTRVRPAGEGQSGAVEAFTVPSIIAYGDGPVDLLKVDIEGSEKEIFGSPAREWLPAIRNIVIELHDGACEGRFFEALEGYQYDLQRQDLVAVCRNLRAPAIERSAVPVQH